MGNGQTLDLTNKFDAKLSEIEENGYCVIPNALSADKLCEIKSAIYRIVEFDKRNGWNRFYPFGNDATANKRIWNLISRDPVFCQLIEHEVALHFLNSILGWPVLLSSTSANIVVEDDMNLAVHADQCYMPEPWAGPHGVNVVWFIDDFYADNGATLVAPGSHRLNRGNKEDEKLPELIPVEGAAGSAAIFDGRLWHSTGRNQTGKPRAGIFNWYTLPIYMPQENWFLSLNPCLRQFGSETLQTLLGFRPEIMGRVNGLAPIVI